MSTTVKKGIHHQLVWDLSELQALKEEWTAFTAAVPQNTDFFASWEAVWHYVTLMKPKKWLIIVYREIETKRLLAVFPLELFTFRVGRNDIRAAQGIGPGIVPYIDYPVVSTVLRPCLQTLLQEVLREQLKIDLVCLWPLHEASRLYGVLLEDLHGSDFLKVHRYPNNQREIETRGMDFETFANSRPSTTYANAHYCERRLRKEGDLKFTLNEEPGAAEGILQKLCSAHEQLYGEQFVYRNKPAWTKWVGAMARALVPSGVAEVSTVRLEGRVIASGLSFWHKRRRYYYLTDYDRAYARYSPGKILMSKLIERTFKECGVFCFGAGAHGYKDAWAQCVSELKAAYVFLNPGIRSIVEPVVDRSFILKLGAI